MSFSKRKMNIQSQCDTVFLLHGVLLKPLAKIELTFKVQVEQKDEHVILRPYSLQ